MEGQKDLDAAKTQHAAVASGKAALVGKLTSLKSRCAAALKVAASRQTLSRSKQDLAEMLRKVRRRSGFG